MNAIGGKGSVLVRSDTNERLVNVRLAWFNGEDLSLARQEAVRDFLKRRVDATTWFYRWSVEAGENGVEQVMKSLQGQGCHVLLAIDANGACVGMLDLHLGRSKTAEFGIVVASDQQRQGHGTRMAKAAIEFAQLKGLCELSVEARGPGVDRWVQNLGFERDKEQDGRYVFSFDTIQLKFELKVKDIGCNCRIF